MTKKTSTKSKGWIARTGRKPIMLGLTKDQHALIKAAADLDGRPMTQFTLRAAIAAAKSITTAAVPSP